MEAPWTLRTALPEDESAILSLWLHSYAHAYNSMRRGANIQGSDLRRRYWREQAPIVEHLLRSPDVTTLVLCDPARAGYAPGCPAVIWAFASMGPGDVIHSIVVKRAYSEFAAEMTRDLIGDRLSRPHVCSHVLTEMHARPEQKARCGVALPDTWVVDEHWVAKRLLPRRDA